ncbi:methyltransferase domain-containing protein [Crossiella sp. NPDC003009]
MTYTPEWLALREPVDAESRATELLDPLRAALDPAAGLVIHDLGCGSGSQARWLSGRLPGPQRWVLHDQDPRLLALAEASLDVPVEIRQGDLGDLRAEHLAGAALVTGSALLDLFTTEQLNGLVSAIVEAGVPALFTLSVAGRIDLDPAEALDAEFEAAFNDHQRRHGLLGPDAPAATTEAFERHGYRVTTRPSTWRLGPDRPELTTEWLHGWVGAAVEQEPRLAAQAPEYLRRRQAGEFRALVHHVDQLALPGAG